MDNHLIPTGKNSSLSIHHPGQNLLTLLLPGRDSLNISEFIHAQAGLTVQTALHAPQVSRLNRENPAELAFAIARLLEFVNKLFNLPDNKKLNDPQIALLSTDIRTRYWFLKFDELVYILREGVAGKWGKSYSRVDAETIHSWFQTYINTERDAVIEQAAHNEAAQFKKQETTPQESKPMPDHIRQELEALRHKLEHEAQPEPKPQPKAPEFTQERGLKEFLELLPTLSLSEAKELLKEAELKQNRELVQLIENELKTRLAT